ARRGYIQPSKGPVMERHDEKRRDMARSILPSKNREAARVSLAKVKRAHRHAVHQELGAYAAAHIDTDEDDPDDRGEGVDLGAYPDGEIGMIVRRRRGGDKLNHFIRWAIAITGDVPVESRLSTMGGMLDDGLIGRHALTHLAREPALNPVHEHELWRRW